MNIKLPISLVLLFSLLILGTLAESKKLLKCIGTKGTFSCQYGKQIKLLNGQSCQNDSNEIYKTEDGKCINQTDNIMARDENLTEETKETGEETKETEGETKESEGETKESEGETKETEGETKETGGETKETGGETKETGGETKETEGDTKESEGETKESEGETKESEGETKETEGKTKETEGETKESEGETKESEGETKESEGETKESEETKENQEDYDTTDRAIIDEQNCNVVNGEYCKEETYHLKENHLYYCELESKPCTDITKIGYFIINNQDIYVCRNGSGCTKEEKKDLTCLTENVIKKNDGKFYLCVTTDNENAVELNIANTGTFITYKAKEDTFGINDKEYAIVNIELIKLGYAVILENNYDNHLKYLYYNKDESQKVMQKSKTMKCPTKIDNISIDESKIIELDCTNGICTNNS